MVKILMKLKQTSVRDFLVTQSGYSVLKDEYTLVDDDDKEIQSYIMNRNDILIKNETKTIKDTVSAGKSKGEEVFTEDNSTPDTKESNGSEDSGNKEPEKKSKSNNSNK